MSTRDKRVREWAYRLWEAEARTHGRDVDHWLRAEAAIPLRITFDTNTIDKACRPERHPKDPEQPNYQKVTEALTAGRLLGFVCDSSMSLEGIQKVHRAKAFGSTELKRQSSSPTVDQDGVTTIPLNVRVQQPARPALHPENVRRLKATLDIGCRVLSAPRVGLPKIDDPDKTVCARSQSEADLGKRLDRYHQALQAIEDRGYGTTPVKAVARAIIKRTGVSEPWFTSLDRATEAESAKIAKAIAEWADGDMIAAHIGYQNDVLCTGDIAISAGDPILSESNKTWLVDNFGVSFMTIIELAAIL